MELSSDRKHADTLTPAAVVKELDKYIVGQREAKRAVAIALRNRWRRQRVAEGLREDIYPKNILMMGPTGVGKTEIARRLAKLTSAPFIKVEATKYTEVGYVGKDVESMIRDLVEISVNMVKGEEKERVRAKAREHAEDRLVDLLVAQSVKNAPLEPLEPEGAVREKFRRMLYEGELENREVQLETKEKPQAVFEVMAVPGMEEMESNIRDLLGNMLPKRNRRRVLKVPDALKLLEQEEAQKLVDMERVIPLAVQRVEQNGIVFLDEIDKIAEPRERRSGGPNVSREGVQRDLLPLIEGSTVNTKYGMVRTDHILFIGAGAFHQAKPSDLVPELQGRFPIRVELNTLTYDDFVRILREPKNSLLKQYQALLETEGIEIEFKEEAIQALSQIATQVNENTENIGARRLHTILERVLDEVSFSAPDVQGKKIEITAAYVRDKVGDLATNQDLSRYIL